MPPAVCEGTNMAESAYQGLLMIGDPHLEGRQPGFRKDNYPEVILDKLAWCLEYARQNHLLPVILGDLFDKPRDNPNWMIVRLLDLLNHEVVGLYGNHDCADPVLSHHDSLSLLVTSGRLRLLTADSPWTGLMGGRTVIVGGSSYRQPIPDRFACDRLAIVGSPLVLWLTHHDLSIPGYDEGRLKPRELPGIHVVINGHIHRRLEAVETGMTRWLTPGNISRRKRSDVTRDHVPAVLRIDVSATSFELSHIEVPHRPFDDVFHEAVIETVRQEQSSAFIAGLAELQARRTASGAGLMEFLQSNVTQFDPNVASEIMNLANEVTGNGGQ
jgi:DNA repair exonuclease SbcCD nuclease subunit